MAPPFTFLNGTEYQPRPGDWITVRSTGLFPTAIRQFTHGQVNHAAMVVDTDGVTVEAELHGARHGRARGYVFRHPEAGQPAPGGSTPRGELAAEWTVSRMGLGYNVRGLAALLAAQTRPFGIETDHLPWVAGTLEQSLQDPPPSAFCSQLVDAAACHVGIHLFTDTRQPGNVSPQQLHSLGEQRGWLLGYLGQENVNR